MEMGRGRARIQACAGAEAYLRRGPPLLFALPDARRTPSGSTPGIAKTAADGPTVLSHEFPYGNSLQSGRSLRRRDSAVQEDNCTGSKLFARVPPHGLHVRIAQDVSRSYRSLPKGRESGRSDAGGTVEPGSSIDRGR